MTIKYFTWGWGLSILDNSYAMVLEDSEHKGTIVMVRIHDERGVISIEGHTIINIEYVTEGSETMLYYNDEIRAHRFGHIHPISKETFLTALVGIL